MRDKARNCAYRAQRQSTYVIEGLYGDVVLIPYACDNDVLAPVVFGYVAAREREHSVGCAYGYPIVFYGRSSLRETETPDKVVVCVSVILPGFRRKTRE